MWSFLNSWGSWSTQNKEREVDTKHTKVEGSRPKRGVEYYQRNKTDEQTAKASETGMDKRKAKFSGRAERASGDQQHAGMSGDAELDSEWQLVESKDLKKLQVMEMLKVVPLLMQLLYVVMQVICCVLTITTSLSIGW